MSVTFVSPALEKFEELDWPVRTDENWRFGSWKEANLSGLETVGTGTTGDLPEPLKVSTGLFSPTVISFRVRLMEPNWLRVLLVQLRA
jgi:hypothetical protein